MRKITLKQAIDLFLIAKQTENLAPHTIQQYRRFNNRFEEFLAARGGTPILAEVRAEDIRDFIGYLQAKTTTYENHPFNPPRENTLSPFTIRSFAACLSAFFHWAEREELITSNPMSKITNPKVPKITKDRFSEEELARLAAACKQYPPQLAYRNKAILFFLLSAGVRSNELCTLTLDNLDLKQGSAKVMGKGAKEREVYYRHAATLAIKYYVDVARPYSDLPYVFLTQEGGALTPDRLTAILRDLGARAGVAKCNPHKFRHTCARLLARNGVHLFSIQEQLGHKDLATTRLYVQLERVDVQQDIHRADVVDRLGLK